MDVLRWLIRLPLQLLRFLSWLVGGLLRPLLGQVSWRAPAWMQLLGRHPRATGGSLIVIAVLAASGWFGWQWYQGLPQPVYTTFNVRAPAVTDYSRKHQKTPVVHPLTVHFSASVAPIEKLDKTISHGIKLTPAVAGKWRWLNDRTLQFTPAADWPVGQQYTVHFDKKTLLAPQVRIDKTQFEFHTQAFKMRLGGGEFYQNPEDARVKQVLQKLSFNYPVDPASLEKNIHLYLATPDGKRGQPVKFSLRYDDHKLHAWIRSEHLALPHDPGRLLIDVGAGVKSARGGNAIDADSHNRVAVPGLYSLHLKDIKTSVADADSSDPQQILVLNFSATVTTDAVSKHLRVWLLPKKKPTSQAPSHGYYDAGVYSWPANEINAAVLKAATPLKTTVNPTQRSWQALQSVKFNAEPGRRLYVQISAGSSSFGGYIMAKPQARVLTVPDYPKQLNFAGHGSLLPLAGDHRVSVMSRNLPGFRVTIGRVRVDQLAHLASLNRGSYSHPSLNYGLSQDQLVDRFVLTRKLPTGEPGKVHYTGIDLGQYFDSHQHGVFWLHLSGFDPAHARQQRLRRQQACEQAKTLLAKPASEAGISACQASTATPGRIAGAPRDSRLVVLTDLGLLVKRNLDGSQQVFVQSISSGRPVNDAEVAVVAVNGKVLLHATSRDGVVKFPSLAGLSHDEKPAMYRVTKGDDMSFLPISASDRQLSYSRFDVGGVANRLNPSRLDSTLFSDRGLYRPGETLHIGAIVRADKWQRSVAGIPLTVIIKNPRNQTVKTLPLALDATGFSGFSYTLADTAATGNWSIGLYITGANGPRTRIGRTSVKVKQFRPDRMKVTAQLSATSAAGWISPDQLTARVHASNLFGTAATNRRVTASVRLQPAWPSFANWPDWHFYDAHRSKQSYQYDLADAHSDKHGDATFALDLSRFANASFQLTFLTQVFEPDSGHEVAAMTSARVSSNPWLLGYHSDDDLSYIRRGDKRRVKLMAIDPDTHAIAVKGLSSTLEEHKYVSILTKQPSGVFKYQSHLKVVTLATHALALPKAGTQLTLDTSRPGNFELVIRNAAGAEVNRIAYTVAGHANVSRSLTRNAELKLTLDRASYSPGDTIAVSINAPYSGSGLITLERDKVYAHVWFHSDTTSSVQHITIPKNFTGNGYINVQFVRNPASDKIYMSPLSYGVAPFTLTHDQHREALTVTAPKLVKPGQLAHFRVQVDSPAKVVVFAVDEGILQVAGYHLKDPLDHFFRKRRLDVDSAQILDLILPAFAKLAAGASTPGGDASMSPAISRHLNPFKRKQKQPAAYWSGLVEVSGSKTFSYRVPADFNGQLRVMAVAVSPQRIGIWQGKTTVRDDFVLSPNAPTMMAPGDTAKIGVGIANNLTGSKAATSITITADASGGLELTGPKSQRVSLKSMQEGRVRFAVRATDTLGPATLRFTASDGTHSVTATASTSVRPASTYRVSIDTAAVNPGDSNSFKGLRSLYAPFAQTSAVMSSSPVVLARGLTSYLVNYPNYCTEQLISAAMPRLLIPGWPAAQAFIGALTPAFDKQPVSNQQALATLLTTLQTRQNTQGGFGIWTATPNAAPFVSTWAMHFLLAARAHGIDVPQGLLNRGNDYLRRLAADDSRTSLFELRTRAYAIYLLTRQQQVTTQWLAAVQKRLETRFPKVWKQDLAAAWLAASYKLLKKDKLANTLMDGPEERLIATNRTAHKANTGRYYGTALRDVSVLYLLAHDFPKRAQALPPQALENIAAPLEAGHYNTLSAAMTLLALDAYAAAAHPGLAQMQLAAVAGEKAKPTPIGVLKGNLIAASHWPADATKLTFNNGSQWPAWRVVTQSGYDRVPPTKAIKNGLEVVRSYTDANGKPITQVGLGQKVTVSVKIRATGSQPISDVAIVDLLPGGFTPVLRRQPASAHASWADPIGLGDSTWTPDFADIRADRIVIYGTATTGVREFRYQIRAVNAGSFQIAPIYAAAMYQPTLQAEAPGSGRLTVLPADHKPATPAAP